MPRLPRHNGLDDGSGPDATPNTMVVDRLEIRSSRRRGGRHDDAPTTIEGDATRAMGTPSTREVLLPPGTTLGRYVLRDSIGVGGMGQVYRAHDPKLDREVAIKRIRAHGSSVEQQRFRREAMAMAQLSHPNVLPVYDVDERHGQPFLVMELVRGRTLRDWVKRRRPGFTTLLDAFVAAGRGLAAAHEAGLVHRDFKPANILIGDDGRVRVMDFGLARAHEDPSAMPSADGTGLVIDDHDLTLAGTVMGTPAYMAPEQLQGDVVGPAADQYAFCVSLWETATGVRPFEATADPERALAERLRGPTAPEHAPWPAGVRLVLHRGLQPDPRDRYSSMDDLIDALERAGRPSPWTTRIIGAGLLVAAAIGLGVGLLGHEEDPCPTAATLQAELWGAPARQHTEQALRDTQAPHAAATWERLAPMLDAYAADWSQRRRAACEALEGGAAVDARIHCLDGRRHAMIALVSSLADADANALSDSIDAAADLPALAECDDDERLAREAPPPPAPQVAAVNALRQRLARLRADQSMGHDAATIEPARALLAEARALDYAPLTIDAQIVLGSGLGDLADPEAIEWLETAYFDANEQGLGRLAARAANMLAEALGVGLGRHDEALRWAEHARVVTERLDDPTLRLEYLWTLGNVHGAAEAHPRCIEIRQEALALARQLHDAGSLMVARTEVALSHPLSQLGRYDEAQGYLDHALTVFEAHLGPQHPRVATVLNRLGNMHRAAGNLDEAETLMQRALAIRESVFGADDLLVTQVVGNLGTVAYYRHDFDTAARLFTRSLQAYETHLGPRHYKLTGTLLNLAVIDRKRGHQRRGLARLAVAREIIEEHFGTQHPQIWIVLNNSANLHEDLGELEQAEALHAEALALGEALHGLRSGEVGASLGHLGNLQSKRGDHDSGLANLQRSLETLEVVAGPNSPEVVHAMELLCYAHRRMGAPERGLPLIEQVVERRIVSLGSDHPSTLFARGLLGATLSELGRTDEALEHLETAYAAYHDRDDVDGDDRAELALDLAKALWARPQQRARARRVARAALEDLETASGDIEPARREIEGWLTTHSP